MLALVNVVMSAILGVAIGGPSVLQIETLSQLPTTVCLVCLLILQAANIGAITDAIESGRHDFVAFAAFLFLIANLFFFAGFASDSSVMSAGSEGIAFPYSQHQYVWLLAILDVIWLSSNVAAALFVKLARR
jgi:hypothetical protein